MEMESVKQVYFVGIGGIGMSALARYFKQLGYPVAGYDRTPSPLTRKMEEEEGFPITYTDDAREVDVAYRQPDSTLVVYTPAVPSDNHILTFFREGGYALHKRAEVLGFVSRSRKALCVAGTHGKTTTTTLLAFLLERSHVGCSAFLGGISSNFGSNLVVDTHSDYVVIEADEFDRSFLHLRPEMAVITAMDADHLDIYGTRACMVEAFEEFARLTGGALFLKKGLTLATRAVDGYYAVGEEADYYAANLRVEEGSFRFDYDYIGDFPTELIRHFFRSFSSAARCNLYLEATEGGDSHHTAEALFKAFARALRKAVRRIPGETGISSTKGVL